MPSYTYKQQQALREADGIQAPWTHTASSGLGVHISNVLTWHTQADATAAEASKTLGVFRRDLSECPKDVKKATVWCPPRRLRRTDRKHTALERQSFNSRVRLSCLGPRHQTKTLPSWKRSKDKPLALFTTTTWQNTRLRLQDGLRSWMGTTTRKVDSLTTLYKIQRGLVEIDTDFVRPSDRRTRGHHRLYQPAATISTLSSHRPSGNET